MLTRLKNWIQGSRRKSGERWEADRGHLSERERAHVEHTQRHGTIDHDVEDSYGGAKAFEERRGRPGN